MYIFYCIPDSRTSFRGSVSRRTGSMWLQNVACVGTEMRLADCPADPADGQQCTHHYQDARVHCQRLGQFIIMCTEVIWFGSWHIIWVCTWIILLSLEASWGILGGWGMESISCEQLPYWQAQQPQYLVMSFEIFECISSWDKPALLCACTTFVLS